MCFLREFFKHPKEVGTFTQSSKTLAQRIAQEIDGSTKIVEFGPGTGAVTTEILKACVARYLVTQLFTFILSI